MPEPMIKENPNPSILIFGENVAIVFVVVSGIDKQIAQMNARSCFESLDFSQNWFRQSEIKTSATDQVTIYQDCQANNHVHQAEDVQSDLKTCHHCAAAANSHLVWLSFAPISHLIRNA